MPSHLGPILPILAASFLLHGGHGLLANLVGVGLQQAGFPASVAGLVAAAQSAGLLAGSALCGRIVDRVGHIRAFASFAAIMSAAALVFPMETSAVLWFLARLATGFATAGLLLSMESWLNHLCDNATRGRTFSVYMTVTFAALGLGPALMTVVPPGGQALFSVAAMVIMVSLLPMSLSNRAQPGVTEPSRLRLSDLVRISPLGVAAAVMAGSMTGTIFGLSPVFATALGHGPAGAAALWLALIGGGFLLTAPLGRLSDRVERRLVMAGGCVGAALAGTALAALADGPLPVLLVVAVLVGGCVFPTYSLAVAHTNDLVTASDAVPAAAGLLLAYGIGAVAGPLVAAGAMDAFGPGAMFLAIAVFAAATALFALYRRRRRPDPDEIDKASFAPLSQTSAAAYEHDPWAGGEEDGAAPGDRTD